MERNGGKPTVVLDLDGVVFRLPFDLSTNFRRKRVKIKTKRPANGFRKILQRLFWLPLLWGWPVRTVNRVVADQIVELSNTFKFVAVTNRRPHLKTVTEDLLDMAGLPELEVKYCEEWESSAIVKAEVATKIKALCVVEDDVDITEFLVDRRGVMVLLRRWYNKPQTPPQLRSSFISMMLSYPKF